MCGRFTFGVDVNELVAEFDVKKVLSELAPSYNAAPLQEVPVIIHHPDGNFLDAYRWGLVPSWAKDAKIGFKMINARAEGIDNKPSFRVPFARQRCLIAATGFFEWIKVGEEKHPFYIHPSSRKVFSFAGIYDEWKSRDSIVRTCAIITTVPNNFMSPIHSRMPVILGKKDERRWLDRSSGKEELLGLLAPTGEMLQAFEVSAIVNFPRNNSQDCVKPLAGLF